MILSALEHYVSPDTRHKHRKAPGRIIIVEAKALNLPLEILSTRDHWKLQLQPWKELWTAANKVSFYFANKIGPFYML